MVVCKMMISSRSNNHRSRASSLRCLLTVALMLTISTLCCSILLLSGTAAAAAAAGPNSDEQGTSEQIGLVNENNGQQEHKIGGFKLSKLFDFSEYQRAYGKKYTNAVQRLARMKLYLGGVLKVIVAAIKHRFLGKRYYLAVNRMTDWTDDEWHQVSVDTSIMKGDLNSIGALKEKEEGSVSEQPVQYEAADLDDIDTKLPEVFKGHEVTFQKFVDDLTDQRRQPDDDESDNNKLSADMLFRSPQAGDSYSFPASNNPNYEPAQTVSQSDGTGNEPTARPLDSSDAEKIAAHSAGDASSGPSGGEKKIEIYSEGPDKIFVDHRQSGCLRPPSHQLECGSCYAFASLALYEYLFCVQHEITGSRTRQPVQFSPQYLVDCAPKRNNYLMGCNGGNPIKVAEFVNQYGLELEVNYPYAGEQQMCPYDDSEESTKMGYIRVDEPGLQILKPVDFDDMLMRQPVLINMYPNSELKAYGGGIYDNYVCEYKYAHAMLLVGSGRKDQQEYWIIRNSLGSEWGEQGYLYMSKGAALNCLVDDGTTSHAKFPSANMNPKYDMKKDLAQVLPFIKTNSEN